MKNILVLGGTRYLGLEFINILNEENIKLRKKNYYEVFSGKIDHSVDIAKQLQSIILKKISLNKSK